MFSDDDFRKLLDHFDRPWAGYRKVRKGVKKRVWRHMQAVGCTEMESYLALARRRPEVREQCRQHLLVTVSRFFRDRRLWEHIRARLLPELKILFPQGLQAWSAGCAGGEEAYSLAMSWVEMAQDTQDVGRLRIKATDANPECLERARRGIYNAGSLKEVPDDLRQRFFIPLPGRQWAIKPHLQSCIDWQLHNLVQDPPPGPFHIVLLRNNLLTYYQGAVLQAALERIIRTIAPGGLLILGSHERLPAVFPFERDEACPWVHQMKG